MLCQNCEWKVLPIYPMATQLANLSRFIHSHDNKEDLCDRHNRPPRPSRRPITSSITFYRATSNNTKSISAWEFHKFMKVTAGQREEARKAPIPFALPVLELSDTRIVKAGHALDKIRRARSFSPSLLAYAMQNIPSGLQRRSAEGQHQRANLQ